jgi:hypothetical protein
LTAQGVRSAASQRGWLVDGVPDAVEALEVQCARAPVFDRPLLFKRDQRGAAVAVGACQLAVRTDATFWWAAGSDELFDDEGALGWRAALALYRAGYWGALAVERFQRIAGLKVDGVVGPKTLAALGV